MLLAQDPVPIKLTEKEGLPDIEFYDIIEDNKHFIWLAADKGLYRFDGKRYTLFSHKSQGGLSVFGLKFDNQNRLWCNNISGQFFYVNDSNLELFLDFKNELKGELAEFFFLKNELILFTKRSIFLVNLVTKKRSEIKYLNYSKLPIIKVLGKFEGIIYFAVGKKIFAIDHLNGIQELSFELPEFGDNIFHRIFSFNKQKYLLFYNTLKNQNTFFEWNSHGIKEIYIPTELQNNTRIITIAEQKNELWFCTSKGVLVLHLENHQFTLKEHFFKNDVVTRSINDINGTIWITTLNNGIFIVPSLQIKSYNSVVIDDEIACIEKITPGLIAIGTTKGNVFLFNLKTGEKEKIELFNSIKVSSLLFLKSKNTLLISFENLAIAYNIESKLYMRLSKIDNAKNLHQIGNSNQFILSSYNKASLLSFDDKAIVTKRIINTNRAYSSFYDEATQEIFVANFDNLMVYDSVFEQKRLTYKGQSIIAKEICKTLNNVIWVSTFNNGILGFKDSVCIKKIDNANGLKTNMVQHMVADGNDLWIVVDNGVQVFNTIGNNFKSTSVINKSSFNNIKDIEIFENKVLLAYQGNLVEIDKSIKPKNYAINELNLVSISINEKETLVNQKFNLPFDQNRIRIGFHINGYYAQDELQFEYRLIGLNENWIQIENSIDFVYFNSLPPNDYTFEIRAKAKSRSEYVYKKIDFKINPPYWKKWWFVLSLVFIGFGIIILFYRNKLAIKEKEKELALKNAKFENELAILKLENLKSQMNPHFIFNALNSIQEYIMLNQKNLASSYLAKFADLIRSYLEHSSKGYISLQEEIECLNIYLELEKLRFEEKFTYKINTSNLNLDIKIPTMLIQPYVENAIKHGLLHKKNDRFLQVGFELLKEEQMLKCIISDNGIGRERASQLRNKKYQSFATKANQNRLELLNFGKERKIGVSIEDIMNENNESNGTVVTLLVPIIK